MSELDAGDGRQGSSALARRLPTGLKHAPMFFPTGHAEGWKVFTVAFGAPAGAAVVSAALATAAGLGVGALAIATFAAPLGMLGANYYWSDRGKRRLTRATALYDEDAQRGLAALTALAHSDALPEVRLEAAARVAIDALGRGDVAAAIEALSIREQDLDRPRRRRNWEAGLRAEVLRSILAWLSPGSFAESGIAPAASFSDPQSDEEGAALLAALRVVERAGHDDDGPLAAAWDDAAASRLQALLPTLHAVAYALAAERLPPLLDGLQTCLRDDKSGLYRGLLGRLFPRMQILLEGGYRAITPDAALEGAGTNLAVIAPSALVGLAELHETDRVPVSRAGVGLAFLKAYGLIGLGTLFLFVVSGLSLWLGAVVGSFAALYAGTPLAAIAGSRLTQRGERARRVAPLRRMVPPPPPAWLTECASGPPGHVTRTTGYRRLSDLPRSQLVLYVAAIKAEQALERAELERAWSLVEWWFSGFTGRIVDSDPMYAVGASLVRVAALCGHQLEARRLLAALAEVGNDWDSPTNRTIYGNAPAAVSFALALTRALEEDWSGVAGAMERARVFPAVYMAPRDEALIREIADRAYGSRAPAFWATLATSTALQAWVDQVLPQRSPRAVAGVVPDDHRAGG